MRFVLKHLLALTLLAIASAAQGAWPDRPVTIIVPFAAGGNVDVTARVSADYLQRALGTPFLVKNDAGAAGVIGTQAVVRATPDGYTLLWVPMPVLAVTPHMLKLSFDTQKDLVPISLVGYSPFFITVSKSFPANTLREFVQYVKDRPNQLSYGTAGPGSGTQISAAAFLRRAELQMIEVPYRGSAPAFADMLGGQIHMMSATATEVQPFLDSGNIKILGISTPEPSKRYPNVQPIAELYPGHRILSWVGLFAPVGTPQVIVDTLSKQLMAAGKTPEFQERLVKMGQDPVSMTPKEFATIIDADFKTMQNLIRDLGLKPQ